VEYYKSLKPEDKVLLFMGKDHPTQTTKITSGRAIKMVEKIIKPHVTLSKLLNW